MPASARDLLVADNQALAANKISRAISRRERSVKAIDAARTRLVELAAQGIDTQRAL
jgi:hypothetical protein